MHEDLQRLDGALAASLRGLDSGAAQLTPSGRPQNWCIQQIIEHLLLSYRSTVDILEARIAKGSRTKAAPTPIQRLSQFCLLRLSFFPPGRKAPPLVTPAASINPLTGDALILSIEECLSDLDSSAARALQLFGTRRCASHFVLGPLSAADWCRFHLIHGRHHIRQIQQIRRSHGV